MPAGDPRPPGPPRSPCIQVCKLDEAGCCIGCFRRGEEIAAWTSMTAEEQWQVVEAAQRRRLDYAVKRDAP